MRIALTGPSGSGKTTLAKHIEERYRLPFISQSAGDIIPKYVKEQWEVLFNYKSKGHLNVIQLGHKHPEFATDFQKELMRARAGSVENQDPFVVDRCPVDIMVYTLLQASMYMTDMELHEMRMRLQLQLVNNYDIIIFVPTLSVAEVEDNDSRIAVKPFQKSVVTPVFKNIMSLMLPEEAMSRDSRPYPLRHMEVDVWDWDARVRQVTQFIDSYINETINAGQPEETA